MKDRIYLFILSGNRQGSTVLYKLIHTSPNVSTLFGHNNWAGEGQHLLRMYAKQSYYIEKVTNPSLIIDYDEVKSIFDKYWNQNKQILCDKSPHAGCIANELEDYFSKFGKVYFICNIRNPYFSYSESNNAELWIKVAKYQQHNVESLKNVLLIRYEDLCDDLEGTTKRLIEFLPELKSLDHNVTSVIGLTSNSSRGGKIENKNRSKYLKYKDNMIKKHKMLKKHEDLVNFFGYKLSINP